MLVWPAQCLALLQTVDNGHFPAKRVCKQKQKYTKFDLPFLYAFCVILDEKSELCCGLYAYGFIFDPCTLISPKL